MDIADNARPGPIARFPTGIPGLDSALGGGIPRGSVTLMAGSPGTGKTTLGNQMAFAHAAAGHKAVVATLMAGRYFVKRELAGRGAELKAMAFAPVTLSTGRDSMTTRTARDRVTSISRVKELGLVPVGMTNLAGRPW